MKTSSLTNDHQPTDFSQSTPEELLLLVKNQKKELARQLDLLREVYTEREMLLRRVQELEKDRLSGDGYTAMSSMVSKIVFVLQQENRPLRSPELIGLLEKREPVLAQHHNKVQYFSAFLSNAVSFGRIIPAKVKGVRGYYYLLPSWVDGDEVVLPPYRDGML
jgi:hypothetical protein